MAQRVWASTDSQKWPFSFGSGSNGAYAPSTGTDAPIDSACTGTSGTNSLTATNASFATGQFILIHQTQGTGAGNYELNRIASYTAGTITTTLPLINTYGTGAQVLVMPQLSSGNIAGGVTITTKAWNGTVGGIYAKFCNGTFTLAGAITGTGNGFRAGGIINGGLGEGLQAEGTPGLGSGSGNTAANGNGGGGGDGGGGGINGAGGGGGGNAGTGTTGQINNTANRNGGTGGTAVGAVSLVTMDLGGGGGGGAGNGSSAYGAGGGIGGGIVIIISRFLTITGTITLGGNNGGSGTTGQAGGGGGGAGGSVLLKGQIITLGTNLITTPAGAGGTSNSCRYGGNGSVGRIHADYSSSLTGTTTPTLDSTLDPTIKSPAGGAFLFQIL